MSQLDKCLLKKWVLLGQVVNLVRFLIKFFGPLLDFSMAWQQNFLTVPHSILIISVFLEQLVRVFLAPKMSLYNPVCVIRFPYSGTFLKIELRFVLQENAKRLAPVSEAEMRAACTARLGMPLTGQFLSSTLPYYPTLPGNFYSLIFSDRFSKMLPVTYCQCHKKKLGCLCQDTDG